LSLRDAGFYETVHVFAEPGTFELRLDDDPGTFVQRPSDERTLVHDNVTARGCFGNWKFALEHLLVHTVSPWLMVLQDDAIWAPDAVTILRAKAHDRRNARMGFLSPYTSPVLVTEEFTDGWNECRAGWGFWGALALCMQRAAAEELLQHSRFANHATTRQVDAVVAASMLDLERPSFVHVPSLVDHIGTTSTIGRDEDSAEGRRGYRFGSGTA
jgi:hypothetical protein